MTKVPTAKVMAGGGVGAAVTLTVLILNNYVPHFTAQPITGEVQSGNIGPVNIRGLGHATRRR